VLAAATHPVGLARTASASASVIVVLFHVERHFVIDCDRDGRSSRMSASARVLQYFETAPADPLGAGRSQCAEALFWGWLRCAMAGFPPGSAHGQPRLPALTLIGSAQLSNSFFDSPGLQPCTSYKLLTLLGFSE
jgi:hypothetical protein